MTVSPCNVGSPPLNGKLRIIGGQWRGRKLSVLDAPGLRPSPDRVRETLFNWLGPWVEGRRCLDLYAGSGILGFEALSRGAAEVVSVDRDAAVCKRLREHARLLGADALQVIQADADRYCAAYAAGQFDLVFLDPPFAQQLLEPAFKQLLEKGCLAPRARVYLETEVELDQPDLPPGWDLYRSRRAGRVRYHLAMQDPGAL